MMIDRIGEDGLDTGWRRRLSPGLKTGRKLKTSVNIRNHVYNVAEKKSKISPHSVYHTVTSAPPILSVLCVVSFEYPKHSRIQMGAANYKESTNGESASQYPFTCCVECTVCSSRPVSGTATTKAADSKKMWTENELKQAASDQVESRNRIPYLINLTEMHLEICRHS